MKKLILIGIVIFALVNTVTAHEPYEGCPAFVTQEEIVPLENEADQNKVASPPSEVDPIEWQLLISEISIKDAETDWVELRYIGELSMDIGDFELRDARGSLATIAPKTTIEAGEFAIFSIEKGLVATTDTLFLHDATGTLLDALCWSNGNVAESKKQAVKELASTGEWDNPDPTQCVDVSSLEKNATFARTDFTTDTNSNIDFTIFDHATPSRPNEIENNPPQAIITIQSGAASGEAPLSINIDGSASIDPDGDEITFAWDFDDGEYSENSNPRSHRYDSPGTYQLSLKITDSLGESTTTILPIVVTSIEVTQTSAATPIPTSTVPTPAISSVEARPTTTASEPQNVTKKNYTDKKEILDNLEEEEVLELIQYADDYEVPETTEPINGSEKEIVTKNLNGDIGASLLITELMPNPEGDDMTEWIEIHNPNEVSIMLGNWQLDDSEGGSKPYIFNDTMAIPPNGYLYLSRKDTKLSLNNSGDEVRLFDPLGTYIDSISYKTADEGKSYALIGMQWQFTLDSTPGAPNPEYIEVAGYIEAVDSKMQTILVRNGETLQTINFEESLLHPLMAPLALPKNAEVNMQVSEESNGKLELRRIASVTPQSYEVKEDNSTSWVVISIFAITLILNLGFLKETIWPYIKTQFRKVHQFALSLRLR
jgi:PKD repeat protein